MLAVLRDATLSGEVTPSAGGADAAAREDGRTEECARCGRAGLAGLALTVLVRDDKVEGLLGGAEAALLPPSVVRRAAVAVLSVLELGFAVFELKEAAVGVLALDARLFSSFGAASLMMFAVGLRAAEDTGRVGGFVMVVPLARDERPLVRVAEGDVVDLEDGALNRSVTDIRFFASSPAVGFAAGVLLAGLFSMSTLA